MQGFFGPGPFGGGFMLPAVTQYTSRYQSMSGLVASWEFLKGALTQTWNGNTLVNYLPDVSGNGYDMTQYNLYFQPIYDPVNGVLIGPTTFLQCFPTAGMLNGASGFSVVFRGIPGTGAANKTMVGISQSGNTAYHRVRFVLAGTSSNKLRLNCNPQATNSADKSILGTSGPSTGAFHILVATYDCASDTVNFYIDGANVGITTAAFGSTAGISSADPKTIILGADGNLQTSGGSNETFSYDTSSDKGYLQELHIFNRALTSTEVGTL